MRPGIDRAWWVAASLLALGCNSGPSDTRAACSAIAHAWCARLWQLSAAGCYDATGYIANYADEQQCEDEFEFRIGQETHTCASTSADACGPAKGYSASQASQCVNGVASTACDQDMAFVSLPGACRLVCCSFAGDFVDSPGECCSGSAHETQTMSCGPSWGSPSVEYICD